MSVQAQILIALRDGGRLFSRPPDIWWIETTDGDHVAVDRQEAWRAIDHLLIKNSDPEPVIKELNEYAATEKGQRVGSWARPDTSLWNLEREWTPEHVAKLEATRAKKLARNVLGVLTFNSGCIRGNQVMFVSSGKLAPAYASAYREPLSEAVMNLIRPHCESFVDVDGDESLRITESGIAATARKRTR